MKFHFKTGIFYVIPSLALMKIEFDISEVLETLDFGGQKNRVISIFSWQKMVFKRNFYHFFTQTDATKFRKINGKSLNCNILHKILHLCCVVILTKMYGFLWFLCDILGAKGRYPWQSDTISVVHSMNFMWSFYNFFEEKSVFI